MASYQMKYVDLFCGGGGGGQGMRNCGWECILAVDNDEKAMEVYRDNFPNHPTLLHDLGAPIPPEAIPGSVDAVLLSPPCQDFTTICKENVLRKGERSKMTSGLAAHVESMRPSWVIFENVKTCERRKDFVLFLGDISRLGYHYEYRRINTRSIGMTQPRVRLILIAHKDADLVSNAWKNIELIVSDSPAAPSLRETFQNEGFHVDKPHCYYPTPRCSERQPSVFSLDEKKSTLFTIRARTRPFPPSYQFRAKDSTHDATLVFPIRTPHAAILQGFPRDFRFGKHCGTVDKIIGNAIPPPLAACIGASVNRAHVPHSTAAAHAGDQ